MRQEHFIQALRHGLTSLPKHEVDEIVADYREYVSDAIAAGRNEEEVIAALGDPAKLARELKAQASYRQWESHRSFSNLMRVVVSLAGLGVINFLLFFPFLIYMLLLTSAYVVSIALMIAGVVMVIGAGGNKLFNWPQFHDGGGLTFNGHSGHSTLLGLFSDRQHGGRRGPHEVSGTDGRVTMPAMPAMPAIPAISDGHEIEGVRIEKDNFIFKLDDGEEANLVLSTGTPVTLESDDGKINIDSDDSKARALIVDQPDGAVSIASHDIQSIRIENSDGRSFSYVTGKKPGEAHWRVYFDDGDDPIHLGMRAGWSLLMTIAVFGIGFMVAGALGLWLCIWISRLTWYGLSRYVKYQINVVMGKESSVAVE